ncbi:MAG: hypothetical protein ACREJY_09200 [Candidatus Rokuibacteriota bacterium]
MPPARSATPRASIAPLLHESLGERVYRTVRDSHADHVLQDALEFTRRAEQDR